LITDPVSLIVWVALRNWKKLNIENCLTTICSTIAILLVIRLNTKRIQRSRECLLINSFRPASTAEKTVKNNILKRRTLMRVRMNFTLNRLNLKYLGGSKDWVSYKPSWWEMEVNFQSEYKWTELDIWRNTQRECTYWMNMTMDLSWPLNSFKCLRPRA